MFSLPNPVVNISVANLPGPSAYGDRLFHNSNTPYRLLALVMPCKNILVEHVEGNISMIRSFIIYSGLKMYD